MKGFKLTLLLILFCFSEIKGQQFKGDEMDFWLGEWELSWINKEGDSVIAQSKVKLILYGKVIHETFRQEMEDGKLYELQSWTALRKHETDPKYMQTSVDSNGNYTIWEIKEYSPSLVAYESERETRQGKILQRFEFHNITAEGFQWRLGWSANGGDLWNYVWNVDYKRKK